MSAILVFDTSGPHVAAALLYKGALTTKIEDMPRGQTERLMPLCEDLMTQAGLGWTDLSRIGVGTGPGNFTGIRISVSAARGLALGLSVPAVGVSLFETTRCLSGSAEVCVPAPRGRFYTSAAPDDAPQMDTAQSGASSGDYLFAAHLAVMADLTAAAPDDAPKPKPLYARAPDAAPPRDAPPELID